MRKYGEPPFTVAVVHGGPGAPGYMAPVARELSLQWGVIEPLLSADSVEGQLNELKDTLDQAADLPVILVGSSWGAMLSYVFAARNPAYVKKLILVGSGAYDNNYPININEIRLARLDEVNKDKAVELLRQLSTQGQHNKNQILRQVATLFVKTDSYQPVTDNIELLETQYEINTRVWREVEQLRNTGELLAMGKLVHCPTVAIHGDYDPHPADGVKNSLANSLADFRFILLHHCGHYPWIEKQAKDLFYKVLREEIASI